MIISLILSGLFVLWLLPGWWNLGFGLINLFFLGYVVGGMKKNEKNYFIWGLVGLSTIIGGFMSLRNFDFVRMLSWLTVILLDVLVVALIKKPRAKLDLRRIVATNFTLIPETVSSCGMLFRKVKSIFGKEDKSWNKIFIGLVAAVPLLFVFGGLFYGADPIFAQMVDKIKLPTLDGLLIWKSFLTLIFFGFVFAMLRVRLTKQSSLGKPLTQILETNVAVILLEILFLIFGLVQARYFFASPEVIRNLGITFSDYTRRGYSQMIIASILAYGIVMWLEYSIRSQKRLKEKYINLTKTLGVIMIGEILIFVASATKRNWMYQDTYGFTRIRLLGFFLSGWLVMMLGLILVKIIKERGMDFFVRFTVGITAVSIVAMNWFNIDRTIVVAKPTRLDSGPDYSYMVELSEDAYPVWEEVVKRAEAGVADGLNMTQDENYKYRAQLDVLLGKKTQLKLESENHWQYGGSWNVTGVRALDYLTKNETRMAKVKADLDIINGNFIKNLAVQKIETTKQIAMKVQERMKTLFTQYSWSPVETQLDTGVSTITLSITRALTDDEVANINQSIREVTFNCYMYGGMGGFTGRQGEILTYQVRCGG